MEDLTLNSSYLMRKELVAASTVAPYIAVVNASAYEWRYMLPPYVIIFCLAVAGNCMVIATLASNRRMRTVTNVYLLNLAVSDLLLGVLCLPFTLVGQMYRRFLFGAAMCKLIPFLQAVSVSVDVWTLVAISLERYFAICRPLASREWQTQCHAYKMIATVWTLSLALNSPILLVSTLQPMRGDAFKCRETWRSVQWERAFTLALDAALLLLPFLLLSAAYCLISAELWRGMRQQIHHNYTWQNNSKQNCKDKHIMSTTAMMVRSGSEMCCNKWNGKHKLKEDWRPGAGTPGAGGRLREPQLRNVVREPQLRHVVREPQLRHVVRSTHIDKSIEAKRKVIRMLFVIILEFFVCWTPLHVINTIYLFYPDELYLYMGSRGVMSLQLLAYCSCCCNPITYCFMNRKFRQAFRALFNNGRIVRLCARKDVDAKLPTPPPLSSSQESWRDSKVRIVFSSGSASIAVSSGSHPSAPAPAPQVIETGEEGSQFLYKISWPRAGQLKSPARPLYE